MWCEGRRGLDELIDVEGPGRVGAGREAPAGNGGGEGVDRVDRDGLHILGIDMLLVSRGRCCGSEKGPARPDSSNARRASDSSRRDRIGRTG